jgi:hypothetical protein
MEVVRPFVEKGNKAYQKEDYIMVVSRMNRNLDQVPCTRYKLMKAECLALLGWYQEA